MRLRGSLAAGGYITKPRRKCTQCGTPARACAHDRDHQPCRVRKPLRAGRGGATRHRPNGCRWPRTTALSSANRPGCRHHVSVSPQATPVLVVRGLALEQSIFSTPVPTRARHGAALDDSSWRQEQAAKPAADHPGRARPFREHGIQPYHDRRNRQRRRGESRRSRPQSAISTPAASGLVRRFRSDEEDIRLGIGSKSARSRRATGGRLRAKRHRTLSDRARLTAKMAESLL